MLEIPDTLIGSSELSLEDSVVMLGLSRRMVVGLDRCGNKEFSSRITKLKQLTVKPISLRVRMSIHSVCCVLRIVP